MTPVPPQFVAWHHVLAGIWIGSAFGAGWGADDVPVHMPTSSGLTCREG